MNRDYEFGVDILGAALSLATRIAPVAKPAAPVAPAPLRINTAVVAPPVAAAAAAPQTPLKINTAVSAPVAAVAEAVKSGVAAVTSSGIKAGAVAPGLMAAAKATVAKAAAADTTKAEAAAKRASAMAVKIAKVAPKAAAKLASHGNRITGKASKAKAAAASAAAKAVTKVKGDLIGEAKARVSAVLAGLTGSVTYQASASATPTGPINLSVNTTLQEISSWAQSIPQAMDAVTNAGQIIATLTPLIAQLKAAPPPAPVTQYIIDPTTGQQVPAMVDPSTGRLVPAAPATPGVASPANVQLAQQGQAIADACQAVMDSFDPEFGTPDISVIQQVADLQTQATSWTTQAQTAISTAAVPATAMPYTPPGTYDDSSSGGGGGGGGDSGGSSGGGDEGGGGGGFPDDDGAFEDDSGGSRSADGGDSMDPDARADARESAREEMDSSDENWDESESSDSFEGGTTVGHFDMHEMDDLNLDQHEIEITDQPADPNRKSASLHHGAAYMQLRTYPRGGATSGQEGGDMVPTERIEIFGGSYERGLDILGAVVAKPVAPPRVQFFHKPTPAGNKAISMATNKPKKGDSAGSIRNAKDAGSRAVKVGTNLLNAIAKGAVKPPVKASVAMARTAVRGVVAKAKPHVRLTPAQIKKIAETAVKSGKEVLQHADKHGQVVVADKNRVESGAKAFTAKTTPHGTSIHGEGDDILGALAQIHGAFAASVLGDDATAAMVVDASMAATDASMTPTDSAAALYTPPVLTPPNGIPVLVPNVDFVPGPPIETDSTQYTSLPLGAIYFDGSVSPQKFSIRSFNSYINGRQGQQNCFLSSGDADGHWGVAEGGWEGNANDSITANKFGTSASSGAPDINRASVAKGWGPLVGAIEQNSPFHGLRYDSTANKYFWFYDQAPAAFKAPGDNLRLQQAMLDYKAAQTAADADAAAAAAQDQLDADTAKAQTRQDALDAAQLAKDSAAQAAQDAITQRQQEQQDAAASRQADVDIKQVQAQAEIDQKAAMAQAEADRAAAASQAEADFRIMQMQAEAEARYAPQGGGDGGGRQDGGGDTDGSEESSFADEKAMMDEQMMGDAPFVPLTGSARLKEKRHRHK